MANVARVAGTSAYSFVQEPETFEYPTTAFVQQPEIKEQSAAKIMDLDIIDELEGDLSKKLYLLLTALAENGLLRYNKS